MPKRKSCEKGYSRSRSTGKCKRRSKKKSIAKRRKRNDGLSPKRKSPVSSPKKDISWVTYYKHYYNDPTFDLKRVDWTGYHGKPPAGLKIRISRRKSNSR